MGKQINCNLESCYTYIETINFQCISLELSSVNQNKNNVGSENNSHFRGPVHVYIKFPFPFRCLLSQRFSQTNVRIGASLNFISMFIRVKFKKLLIFDFLKYVLDF